MDSSIRSAPRVAVLGPVLVEDRSGALAEPSGALGKSLIVSLVLSRGTVSVSGLVHDLWDDAPPRQERAALQTLVSRVRAVSADGLLESTTSGYALALAPEHTDLGLARRLLDNARDAELAGDPARAENDVTAALGLWRGEPGSELGETPLAAELERTARRLQADLLLVRARSQRALGDAAGALADLEPLVAESPLDESLHREFLLALDAAGRRNDALRAFAEFRTRLRDELGTRPGPELVAVNASLLLEDEPPLARASEARVRIGLRTAPNALLGREYDLDALEDLIATGRLTTILGAGGLGKTRLAQEIGHRAERTPAVIVVELASVRTGDDIELALASTLGIREARTMRLQSFDPSARMDLRARILSLLAERQTLLIMDNCEHIVDAAAAWIADILESTTNVRVLATSRAPLSIGAERVYPLDSLSSGHSPTDIVPSTATPTDTSSLGPAVALFVERARAARPNVVLPLDVVVRLCDRLDGLPLAIELAAARTRSMSVDEIERRLSNRFTLLTGGERTAPERHRTLLAVIDWSWNLLGDSERTLLRRLSRFPDGFSAEAAEAVAGMDSAGGIFDELDALVNQSLVSVAEDTATGILRYRMLETVREFGDIALTEAGEVELVRDGMYRWARHFSRDALAHMNGAEQVYRFQLVTAEQDNLVAVLRSSIAEGRTEIITAVFATLAYYWTLRSAHSEVIAFGPTVMDALRGYQPARVDPGGPEASDAEASDAEVSDAAATYAIIAATFLFIEIRMSVRAVGRLERAKRGVTLSDPRLEALTSLVLSSLRPAEGLAKLTQYKLSGDPGVAATANLMSAQFLENSGELAQSMIEATLAYDLAVRASDTWAQSSSAGSLAQLHSQLAHPRDAIDWAERAKIGLSALQADGDLRQLDWLIGINSISVGDLDRGRRLLERFVTDDDDQLGFDVLDLRAIGQSGFAEIALAAGDIDEGLRRYREAVAVFGNGAAVPNPWLNMVLAACLMAHIRAGSSDPALVERLARDLRTRILVVVRMQPTYAYIDKPVLGSGSLGIASWLLCERGDAEPSADQVAVGLELFALAGRLNSRQDLLTTHRDRFEREVRAARGDSAVGAALASVAQLSVADAAVRAVELVRATSHHR